MLSIDFCCHQRRRSWCHAMGSGRDFRSVSMGGSCSGSSFSSHSPSNPRFFPFAVTKAAPAAFALLAAAYCCCAFSPRTHNSERVGWRRPPIQLGLALAPALTCCLSAARLTPARISTAGIQRAPELSRDCREGSSSSMPSHQQPSTNSNRSPN
jgi:hypothetical protein